MKPDTERNWRKRPIAQAILHEQIILRCDADEVFDLLTCWRRLPDILPFAAPLRLVSGQSIDEPADVGDALVGKLAHEAADRMFIVTSKTRGLLWSLGCVSLDHAEAAPLMTLALRPMFGDNCLLAVQLFGPAADAMTGATLRSRIRQLRDDVEIELAWLETGAFPAPWVGQSAGMAAAHV